MKSLWEANEKHEDDHKKNTKNEPMTSNPINKDTLEQYRFLRRFSSISKYQRNTTAKGKRLQREKKKTAMEKCILLGVELRPDWMKWLAGFQMTVLKAECMSVKKQKLTR